MRLALVRAGHAILLDPAIARGKACRVEIAGPAGKLIGAQPDGAGELVIVLGRALPDDDAVRALAIGVRPPDELHVLRRPIVLAEFSHTARETLLGGCTAVARPAPARSPPARRPCGSRPGKPHRL